MQNFERAGVAVVTSSLLPRWKAESNAILETLKSYHRHAASYQAIKAISSNEVVATLKKDLCSVAPSLAQFAAHLQTCLQASGCAVFIPELGLGKFDDEQRARLLYALSICIGDPTATDAKGEQVVWDVAPRRIRKDYFPTFSEHDGEAAFHTDTQYYPVPERYFVLYVMSPAACGGGLSVLCDGDAVRSALERPASRWALRALEERPLPFRVPSAFVTDNRTDIVQATVAPVFSSCPSIRYRRDTLLEGLAHFPEYRDGDTERAVHLLDGCVSLLTVLHQVHYAS